MGGRGTISGWMTNFWVKITRLLRRCGFIRVALEFVVYLFFSGSLSVEFVAASLTVEMKRKITIYFYPSTTHVIPCVSFRRIAITHHLNYSILVPLFGSDSVRTSASSPLMAYLSISLPIYPWIRPCIPP